MGLDVYKMKIVENFENGEYIDVNDVILANVDSSLIKTIQQEFYNLEQTLLNLFGLKFDELKNLQLRVSTYDKSIYTHEVNGKEVELVVHNKDLVEFVDDVKVVLCEEIAYQRKQAHSSYYDKYTSCEYMTNNKINEEDEEKFIYVFDNDLLNEMKQHFEWDAPIQKWTLDKNEFVWFSY